jgi:hypothetical protein
MQQEPPACAATVLAAAHHHAAAGHGIAAVHPFHAVLHGSPVLLHQAFTFFWVFALLNFADCSCISFICACIFSMYC